MTRRRGRLTSRFVSVDLPFVQTYQADALTALGDPTRRAIFEHLADRPRAVGELASELPVSRPAVSQHLKVLKDARLVVDRREGTRRIYQLDPDGLRALRGYLDHFWDQALAGFKAAVEQQTKESE
jgi:DNA-binding transcriptional ArsR family regulator